MITYTICKSCKNEIKVKTGASTRPDLENEKGTEFTINCQNCGSMPRVHVNDVRARENPVILLFGAGVGVLVTAILWLFLGAIATMSFTIPLIVYAQQASSVKAFNSYLIRRR